MLETSAEDISDLVAKHNELDKASVEPLKMDGDTEKENYNTGALRLDVSDGTRNEGKIGTSKNVYNRTRVGRRVQPTERLGY